MLLGLNPLHNSLPSTTNLGGWDITVIDAQPYFLGPGILPPPPQNPENEYGYCCFVTGIKQQSCPRLRQNLRGSKFKNFPGGGGGHAPRSP